MPQPRSQMVHVDRPLTTISIAYMQGDAYIADKVFPIVPVEKKSDLYYTYTKADWFRNEAQERAPGTESVGSGYGLSTDSYSCRTYALHKDVPWDIETNADAGIEMYRDATEFVTDRLLLQREISWKDKYFTTSKWGTDLTGVDASPTSTQFIKFSDYTNSDPVAAINVGRRAIHSVTGKRANTLVIGEDVFECLKQHPDIVDRFKYTQAGIMTADLIARIFEIDRLIVASAIVNSADEGQTASMNYIFGKSMLLLHVAPRPGLLTPSAGYTFAWKNLAGANGNGYGVAVSRFEMRKLKADRVEAELSYDQKLVATDLGVFYSSVMD